MAIRQDELKKFFDWHKVPDEVQTFLLDDSKDPEEDFEFDKAFEKYQGSREDFYKAKYLEKIKTEVEDQVRKDTFIQTVKPITNKIRQLGGFTEEELKDKDYKDQIDLLHNRLQKKIEEAKSSNDDDLKKELKEYQKKWEEAKAKADDWETNYQSRVKELEENQKKERESRLKRDVFLEEISNPKLIEFDKNHSVYADLIYDVWPRKDGVKFVVKEDENGKKYLGIESKGGAKAMTLDGRDTYSSALQYIKDKAKAEGILKVSNGGHGPGGQISKNKLKIGEKEIDTSGVNWLKKQAT